MGLKGLFNSFLAGSKVDVFARYEVLREAVSGTMSKFYQVRDRESGEVVGLKILDKEKSAMLEAWLKGAKKPPEGEIACKLKHPRLVETRSHGVTTKGEEFVVMDFVEGAGLNSLIIAKDQRLEGKRLPLIRMMAEAVQAVHDAGFIHRDICPRNFVVSPDFSEITLIDFGLTVPSTPIFKAPGLRTGTPNYMAPELIRRKPTDERLDIFALGVTYFEMCTFRLPWEGGGGDGRAAVRHSTHPPTPIDEVRGDLPPQLARAIMKSIEQDPDKRLASAERFLREIEGVPAAAF